MRSNKRRNLQPLNFTPDEPKVRRGEEAPRASASVFTAGRTRGERDAAQAPEPTGRPSAPTLPGWARTAYLWASLAALAWALLLFTYTIGYVGGLSGLAHAPMQLAVVVLMAVLPAVFILAAAYALRQGARLAAEARWTRSTADAMLGPALLTAAGTGELGAAIRTEVERLSSATLAAHGQLISVREALSGETERLGEATAQAQHTARVVGETLGRERDGVRAVMVELQGEAGRLADGVERQSRMVAEASDLARSQLQEAEATLASGAERLTAATGVAGAAARDAGDGLARQAERLDVAAAALSERLRFLDARLNDQRHALSNLLHTLDTDQDDVAARLESHRAQMLEVLAEARQGAVELQAASHEGGQALRGLLDGARDQAREIAGSYRTEQDALRVEAMEARLAAQTELHRSLDALARAGEDARRAIAAAAGETEAAVGLRVGAARHEVEQLNELSFAAAQRADQAFQGRLGDARRMIEQTAALVEQAGQRAGERIEAGLGASRGALGELAGALGDIDAQLARLPQAARAHAEAVRAGVEESLSGLTASARRASEETQGLDAAFQDRIRRNYETLSEAVRLMGRVAGAVDFSRDLAPTPARAASLAPPPPEPQRTEPARAETTGAEAPVNETTPSESAAPPAPAASPDPLAAFRDAMIPPAAAPSRARVEAPRAPGFAAIRPSPPTPVFGRAAVREPEAVEASAGPADLLLEPAPAAAAPPPGEPADGLRPRLRFTPTEADEALKAVFTPRAGAPEPAATPPGPARPDWSGELDEWTWKDLLSSMDEPPPSTDTLADQMIREVEQLGVDSAALLPRARVEAIASALQLEDAAAARDGVRRLAPAAIRRLSRRVLTDRPLREQVDRYVERYQTLLRDTPAPDGVPGLLSTDAGRAYLLLEAAVGDL